MFSSVILNSHKDYRCTLVPRLPFPVPRSPFPVPRSPFPVPGISNTRDKHGSFVVNLLRSNTTAHKLYELSAKIIFFLSIGVALQWTWLGVTNTGNGERGTGNGEPGTGVWERMYSGNPYKNSKWRTKSRKMVWKLILSTRSAWARWAIGLGFIEWFYLILTWALSMGSVSLVLDVIDAA